MAVISITQGASTSRATLKAGVNRVGRAEGNDVQIVDGSVSGRHCELELFGEQLRVRDVGSTNGTFIDSRRITDEVLLPGQRLVLGQVLVQLEDAPVPLPPPFSIQPLPVAASSVPQPVNAGDCLAHPGTLANYICQKCQKLWCSTCIKSKRVGGKNLIFCPECNSVSIPTGQAKGVKAVQAETFGQAVAGAFSYPFRKNGLILVICGTILYAVLDFLSISMFIRVFAMGYLFAYMQKIIVSTAAGDEDLPAWPDFSEWWSDIIHPFILWIGTGAVSFGPGIAMIIFVHPIVGLLALLLGVLYFPMALLSVAMQDSLSGLNPLFVIGSIAKIPGPYAVACLVLAVIFGLSFACKVVTGTLELPVLPALLSAFFALLFLTIEMRILGLVFYKNRSRLGWL